MYRTYNETNPFIAQIDKISTHIMNKYEKINWNVTHLRGWKF